MELEKLKQELSALCVAINHLKKELNTPNITPDIQENIVRNINNLKALVEAIQPPSGGEPEQSQHINIPAEEHHFNYWHGQTLRNRIDWHLYNGDAYSVLKQLPADKYNCVITSPPYFWLRSYGVEGQLGLEASIGEYVNAICKVMDEVYRVLHPEGVLFLNLGDTYYSGKGESQGKDPKSRKRRFGLRAVDRSGGMGIGLRPKTIIGIPWRVAIEMSQRNWILRSPIIWHRQYSLPEAVKDRPRRNYEFVFMFVKNRKYYFDRAPLKNVKEEDMWTIPARPETTDEISTAPYPDELVQRCLDIGCKPNGHVLDPFAGSGTTLRVSLNSGRLATGIELNPEFCQYILSQL